MGRGGGRGLNKLLERGQVLQSNSSAALIIATRAKTCRLS